MHAACASATRAALVHTGCLSCTASQPHQNTIFLLTQPRGLPMPGRVPAAHQAGHPRWWASPDCCSPCARAPPCLHMCSRENPTRLDCAAPRRFVNWFRCTRLNACAGGTGTAAASPGIATPPGLPPCRSQRFQRLGAPRYPSDPPTLRVTTSADCLPVRQSYSSEPRVGLGGASVLVAAISLTFRAKSVRWIHGTGDRRAPCQCRHRLAARLAAARGRGLTGGLLQQTLQLPAGAASARHVPHRCTTCVMQLLA